MNYFTGHKYILNSSKSQFFIFRTFFLWEVLFSVNFHYGLGSSDVRVLFSGFFESHLWFGDFANSWSCRHRRLAPPPQLSWQFLLKNSDILILYLLLQSGHFWRVPFDFFIQILYRDRTISILERFDSVTGVDEGTVWVGVLGVVGFAGFCFAEVGVYQF